LRYQHRWKSSPSQMRPAITSTD